MRPILFHIAGYEVSSFWAMAFLAWPVGYLAIRRELQQRGSDPRIALPLVVTLFIGGWLGARLLWLPKTWPLLLQYPSALIFSTAGWVWYGGVIGGALAGLLFCRWRRLPYLYLTDVTAPALGLGQGIGRLGCHLSGDGDYGVPTDLPWGMSYPEGVVPTEINVHPTPLYELFGLTTIFVLLTWRGRGNSPPGTIFGGYLILSGLLRFAVELVRLNPAWLLGLTTAQWFSIASVVAGTTLVVRSQGTVAHRRGDAGVCLKTYDTPTAGL